MSIIGKQFQDDEGKRITVTGSYEGETRCDPPGYYYRYVGEKKEHWVSAFGFSIRFKPIWPINDREYARVHHEAL